MMRPKGFTLIEVLIALVILSIALSAVVKTTSQLVRETGYLEKKTLANGVATFIINEFSLSLRKPTAQPHSMTGTMTLLNQSMSWQAEIHNTPNVHIKKIIVSVFDPITHARLMQLESYLYEA